MALQSFKSFAGCASQVAASVELSVAFVLSLLLVLIVGQTYVSARNQWSRVRGRNASLMFSRGLPRKVATNVAATFRPKGQRLSLSVQFSKSAVKRAPRRDGVGGQCNWPAEHEVGEPQSRRSALCEAPGGANPWRG